MFIVTRKTHGKILNPISQHGAEEQEARCTALGRLRNRAAIGVNRAWLKSYRGYWLSSRQDERGIGAASSRHQRHQRPTALEPHGVYGGG